MTNGCPIKGFQGTSLIEYPGRIASIIYTGGCNYRCRFCYNRALVLDVADTEDYDTGEILGDLRVRRGFVEGVVVTGGEPTIHPGLIELLRAIKRIGPAVKLDTNGGRPDILEWVLEERLADYVAMDYKAPLDKLESVIGVAGFEEKVNASAQLLIRAASCRYEFRTTVHPLLHDPFDIDVIADEIEGAAAYYVQQYHPADSLDTALIHTPPYPPEFFYAVADRLRGRFPTFDLRNLPKQPTLTTPPPADDLALKEYTFLYQELF